MLSSLNIKDVVLIDRLELNFDKGLTIFTGETGAGKSIMLDSLSLAMGGRADVSLIRNGEKQLQVIALFTLSSNHKAFDILKEMEIDVEDNQIILKRVVNVDGKSKAFINDIPVTLNVIKKVSETLVEIHGQFLTHGLLDNGTHVNVLDAYGGYSLNALEFSYDNYNLAKHNFAEAMEDFKKIKSDEEYLRHNLNELLYLKIRENEYQELTEKIGLAANSEKIYQALGKAYEHLSGDNIVSNIRVARGILERIGEITNEKYRPYLETLERLEIDLKEMLLDIGNELHNQDLDPNSLDDMQERLYNIKSLAKKHGVLPEELYLFIDVLKEKVEKIDLGSDYLIKLKKQLEQTRLDYLEKARNVSMKRKEAGLRLDEAVMNEFPALKLNNAKFKTEVLLTDDVKKSGMDSVKFKVITNAGGSFEDLSKIASGGELSRFMLALKVNLSDGAETLIFDEVDAGIGGATATAVGQRLKRLSKEKQVLVVTHSPQVASFGKSHHIVKKYEKDESTFTTVTELDEKERINEIARMLAGEKITEASLKAAKQLVDDNERA